MRSYLPWIGIPLALLAVGALLSLGGSAAGGAPDPGAMTGIGKGRSALKFHALTQGGMDETPVYTVARPGFTIDITIDPDTYRHMLIPSFRQSYKRRTTDVAVSFGGLKPTPATLKTRGASSLRRGDRLNFSITMLRPVMITPDIEMDRFYLVNLIADPHQFKLQFAYGLLTDLGLFFPLHEYASVLVNGEPQGMFMLVERPRDAIRRVNKGTVSVFRRGRPEIFRRQWSKSIPFATQNIDGLQRVVREGAEDTVAALEEVIDLKAYLTWMAVNSILKNDDTDDELFLFEVRKDRHKPQPLRLMAWDYDEIYQEHPAEHKYTDPLLFATWPTQLDLLIRKDPALYERFRKSMQRLLTTDLTIEHMVERLREVQELRDGLDDGLGPAVQEESRRLRAVEVDRFEQAMRERHATLLERMKMRGEGRKPDSSLKPPVK